MQDMKFRPYRNELRKIFVWYAMAPIILLTAIAFLLIFVAGYMSVEQRNRDSNLRVTEHLENNLLKYQEKIMAYSVSEAILEAILYENKRHTAYEKVYEFVNHQEIKCNFYFFNSGGEMVMSNTTSPPDYIKDSSKLDWGVFKRMRLSPEVVSVSINRVYSPLNKYSIFTLGKAVWRDGRIQGYLIFELLENDLFSLISSISNNDTVVTDRYYNVAAATNNNYTDNFTKLSNAFRRNTGKLTVNGLKYYLYRSEFLSGNFFVYTMTTLNYYETTFLLGGLFLTILLIIITLVMVLVSKRISAKKTVVIDDILEAITSVQSGNLDTELKIDSHDEFQIIAQSYNKMLADIKNLIEQNKEETKRSMLAEVKQLESQFNPHFLYNTLETIRCMVKLSPQQVDRIIVNLSALLRYSIDNAIKTVTLGEDLEHTKNYLEILKYRFNQKFDYEIHIEEEALDCIVPKLLIQPIIENAVKHGFEGKDHLTVRIKARFFGEQLIIVIYDDGVGMSEDKVDRIRAMLKDDANDTVNIGLYNVNRRIRLMYGKAYGLDIMSEKCAGTTIRISIPADQ